MNFNDMTARHVGEIMMEAMEGSDPSSFFKAVVNDKSNFKYFPEFFKMLDIPAGPESVHHPKGETVFDHSMIVLDNAVKETKDPVIRLAAALHDMGKIATPADNYPHHYAHDSLGVELVRKFCERLELDEETNNICQQASAYHMKQYKKEVKWVRLGFKLKTERELESLKRVIKADSDNDLSGVLDLAFKVGHMTNEELGLDDPNEQQVECAKIIMFKELLNNS